jgi:hypothetical protein
MAVSDTAFHITDNHQSAKRQLLAAFGDFGNAADRNNLFNKF